MIYIMAINETTAKALLNRLDELQKEINAIHQQLLIEIGSDELTAAEKAEIEAIRKENNFRTFDEWEREKPLD